MIDASVQTIRVNTAPPYEVLIGRGLLTRISPFLRDISATQVLVVTSRRVSKLHGSRLRSALKGHKLTWIELPDGERVKDIGTLGRLLQRFARSGADRKSCVVAFGGGSIGDLAGLAASIYMRGIPVVQVPTTLLAQVDASVGGKTAINLENAKNLVGTFHQPALVLSDTSVLSTLSDRDFRAGLFEVIKCGAICDAELFSFCERFTDKILKRDAAAVERIVTAAIKIKAEVVSADPKESGLRRVLNFGHTIGHALEAAGGYLKLLHGEAVALGMIAAAEIGVNMDLTPPETAERLISCILQFGPLPKANFSTATVLRSLASDKKSVSGRPHFILLDRIGSTLIRNDVPDELIRNAVRSVTA
jgi:3-dehydroquinate synthase